VLNDRIHLARVLNGAAVPPNGSKPFSRYLE
jgi:hypothetical protein